MLFRLFTILAVAALAISTWLLTSPGRAVKQGSNDQHSDLPGYYLKNATLTDFDESGNPGVRIAAERIDQVARGTDVAMYNVKLNYQPPEGASWEMVGDTAHVQAGSKVIEVKGNVKVTGDASAMHRNWASPVIRTEVLSYDIPNQIVSTPADVRVQYGKHTLLAHGLSANLKDESIRLESKISGRFFP